MQPFTATGLEGLAAELADHNHPHFLSALPTADGIRCFFKPFTGDEEPPRRPANLSSTTDFTADARLFLDTQYTAAFDRWYAAHLNGRLSAAAPGAEAAWSALTAARQTMNSAYEDLDHAADGHWRAALSRLVTAQEQALAAAARWDTEAGQIAIPVADARAHLGWGPADFQRTGVQPAWAIAAPGDYSHRTPAERPMHREINAEIERQRAHLRAVAELAGEQP